MRVKLYNQPLLVVGLLCGLGAIHAWKNLGGNEGVIWIGFFLYLMLRCVLTAFTKPKENNEEKS